MVSAKGCFEMPFSTMSRRFRAVEFFSGIGGYHAALRLAELPVSVVAAFDINTHANAVYNFNFGAIRWIQALFPANVLRYV
jgi:site-specific DNA-cytosine methylase